MNNIPKIIISILFCFLIFSIFGMYMAFHQHDNDSKLKAECEARGGMLIHTGKSNSHACVGKPK